MFRSLSRIGLIVVVVALALASAASLAAQGARGGAARGAAAAGPSPMDPFIGTWRLDRSKSTFTGAIPEWRTHKFEKVANGIKHTTQSMIGEVVGTLTYTFQVDGKDYPADTAMAVNTVSFKQVDANTIERSGKYQGTLTETVTYQLSNGGKTLTVNQMILANDTGSTQVFDKQP